MRVALLSKKVGVDWRRKADGKTIFRPGEKALTQAMRNVVQSIPPGLNADLIEYRISTIEFQEQVVAALEPHRLPLEHALFAIMLHAARETEDRIRRAVNENLLRLGSEVHLARPGRISKAAGVDLEWWGVVDPAAPLTNIAAFNYSDPANPLRIAARNQSGQILSNIAATEQTTIMAQISAGFTDLTTIQQGVARGAVVTGRTTIATAEALVSILESTGPAGMTLTPGELALYRSNATNGLFPRWATAVNNFADRAAESLTQQGVRSGTVMTQMLNEQTSSYAARLRFSRARMIARTETSIAQNAARQASMTQVVDSGVAGSKAQKRWVTSRTDVCPICSPMGGRLTGVRDFFSWQGGSGNPPAHPNCQCQIRLVPNITKKPELLGGGTPQDPFRYRFADGWEAPINPVAG